MKYLVTILIIVFQVALSLVIAHGYVRSHTVYWPIIIVSYVFPIILFASINVLYFRLKCNFKFLYSVTVALLLGIFGFLISALLLTMFFGE
jgi:hypothetical protein